MESPSPKPFASPKFSPLKKRPTFYNGKDDPTLQVARDATTSQPKFWRVVERDLRKDQIKRVDAVVQSYEDNHTLEGLESLLGEYLPAADDEVGKLYDKRAKGGKQVSSHIQQFAKTFSDFLGCYSQVLELVKSADNQFGGVAVHTLSLLLIVGVNKSDKEELIETSLVKIKHNFPRLKHLHSIYPDEKLQKLIAQVYESILVFAQRAIEYYRRSAWTRVWQAIAEPPQLGVKLAVDKILDELAEVKEETNILLNGRVQDMEISMKKVESIVQKQSSMLIEQQQVLAEEQERINEMRQELDKVTNNVGQIKRNQSEELLSNLTRHLNPDEFSHTDHLEYYREQIHARFFNRRKPSVFTLDELLKDPVYQKWKASPSSRTLVLRGRTTTSQTALSWLSHAAVQLVDRLKEEYGEDKDTVVVYHFCKVENMLEDDHMHTTLSRLIYQLLQSRPSILHERNTYASFKDSLESPAWQKQQVKAACKLLVEALNQFKTVYLVLDRPEACRGGVSGLTKLLEQVSEAECTVKTFVVVDKDECDDSNLEDWRDAVDEGVFAVLDDLDQA